jgi:predicted nucleotidyltransferase
MKKVSISKGKDILLQEMVTALKEIPGVVAIVLGGSQAAGQATPDSDLDIGIYYYESNPFNIDSIRNIANQFSSNGEAIVTGLYEWGPWVNGGAWIETKAGKVDFLYRNINQVQQVVSDAQNGIWYLFGACTVCDQ